MWGSAHPRSKADFDGCSMPPKLQSHAALRLLLPPPAQAGAAIPLAWLVGVYLRPRQLLVRLRRARPNPVHVCRASRRRLVPDRRPGHCLIVRARFGFAAITYWSMLRPGLPAGLSHARGLSLHSAARARCLSHVLLFSSLFVRLTACACTTVGVPARVGGQGRPQRGQFGFSESAMAIAFSYVWLRFMILPVYAALERVPGHRGLARAKGSTTFGVAPCFWGVLLRSRLRLGDFITWNRTVLRRRQPPADRVGTAVVAAFANAAARDHGRSTSSASPGALFEHL